MREPFTGPPDSYYIQPDPVVCCEAYENGETDDDHDPMECLAEQAEDAAEARAEARAEADLWDDDDV